jgi:tetratricopeptide (TPR) repeat protein
VRPLGRSGTALAVAALLVGVALLYAPALRFEWLSFDDPSYVTQNPLVLAGLTPAGARWAFTSAHAGNWHPLTWLSHMLDVELFGLDSAGHHASNVALHALNSALLFLVLLALTRRRGCSLAVAALFALHPIQLESVAWVAERKNLLSTTFGLLAIGAYAGYVRRPGALRYAGVAALFAASLLAKAMLVTLPFVLLLLDVWPLRRVTAAKDLWRVLPEKLPLLALSAGVSALVYGAQARAGAMDPAALVPWSLRLAYLPIAYATHVAHLLWPLDLAVLYPHPLIAESASLDGGELALCLLALALPSALALLAARRGHAAFAVGWLLFLGTLVPVSGVVQVGWQALADRYAYVPSIGLWIALVFGSAAWFDRLSQTRRKVVGAAALAAVCTFLAAASHAQLGHWKRSRTLFEHAIAVTGPNPVMHNELGVALAREGSHALALAEFETAVSLAPAWASAQQNLGAMLATLGRGDEGLRILERSIELAPNAASGYVVKAFVLLGLDRHEEAREPLARALVLEPDSVRALSLQARLLLEHPDPRRRDPAAAVAAAERAIARSLAADPALLELLANAYAEAGRFDDAVAAQRKALAALERAGTSAARSAGLRAQLEQWQRRAAAGAHPAQPSPPAAPPR